MAAKGWISLHRKIQECFLWGNDEPFDRRSAWIDLLLLANHKDAKTMFDGQPITVKEGQRITSIRILAQRWGWSTKKTTKFLSVLESENMIVKESDKRKTLITIVNYGIYQDVGNSEETVKKHRGNTEETLRKHRLPTNNNDNNENNHNNENNENNNNPPTPLPGEWDADKHSNIQNFEHLVETEMNEVKNTKLLNCVRDWLTYKDGRKPKSSNHYQLQTIRTLTNKVFESAKQYGADSVIGVVNDSISNNYQGILWTNLERYGKQSKKNDKLQEAKDYIQQLREEEEANEEE